MRMVKVLPLPKVLAAETVPPWAWTMCLTIDSPSRHFPSPRRGGVMRQVIR